MRFPVVALVPHDTTDIVAKATRQMDPYSVEHEVSPYKEYLHDAEGIARLAAAFRLPTATPEAVAAEIVALGDEAGVDEEGLYWITTRNPRGRWDGWMLHNLNDDVKPVAALSRDVQLSAVITPDGEWHDFLCGWDWPEERKVEYQQQAHDLIATFPDCLAVILDCHW